MNKKQIADLFSHATRFTFLQGSDPIHDKIHLEKRYSSQGNYWIIKWGQNRWNKNSQTFVYELQPSNRSEDFVNETKFTLEEAYKIVSTHKLLDEYVIQLKNSIKEGGLS